MVDGVPFSPSPADSLLRSGTKYSPGTRGRMAASPAMKKGLAGRRLPLKRRLEDDIKSEEAKLSQIETPDWTNTAVNTAQLKEFDLINKCISETDGVRARAALYEVLF